MRLLVCSVVLVTLIGIGGAGASAPAAAPHDDGACRSACFARKSRAYQRCRAVPPRDREAREGCFRRADAALERCLAACGK